MNAWKNKRERNRLQQQTTEQKIFSQNQAQKDSERTYKIQGGKLYER